MCPDQLHSLSCLGAIDRACLLQGPRKVIKQFQEDPDTKVFLLTRGQGAAGLTLTQGDFLLQVFWISKHAACKYLQVMVIYRRPFPWSDFVHPLCPGPQPASELVALQPDGYNGLPYRQRVFQSIANGRHRKS